MFPSVALKTNSSEYAKNKSSLFALLTLLWLGGFVVFLNVRDLGEPVVFAIDGTHVADEGV